MEKSRLIKAFLSKDAKLSDDEENEILDEIIELALNENLSELEQILSEPYLYKIVKRHERNILCDVAHEGKLKALVYLIEEQHLNHIKIKGCTAWSNYNTVKQYLESLEESS